MNAGHRQSQRVSPPVFAALLAVVAALALLLLRRARALRLYRPLLLRLGPGLAAVVCVAALYYEQRGATLLRLAVSAVFLQLLMICAARLSPSQAKLE
jgi:hypothetical protein